MNDLLLRVARGEATDRPPVWLMRQAGRILPQYNAIRSRLSGFKELVETPELACEVTIQPVDELEVDAAILFSDILVIPEALGLPYEMYEKKGPQFPKTIETAVDIDALLPTNEAAERLHYVYDAIKLTVAALNGRVPLIGFAGAPFTIFAYMIEGSGSKTFSKAKRFMYQQPALAHQLLDKITDLTIAYLQRKVAAGVQLVQVFDSWAGILSKQQFDAFSLPYLGRIARALNPLVPVTLFAKGANFSIPEIAAAGANTVGLDWTVPAAWVRSQVGNQQTLQGNLDPCLLYAPADVLRKATIDMLQSFGQHHIANLGHGVYPDTPLDNVKVFVETVKSFRYSN